MCSTEHLDIGYIFIHVQSDVSSKPCQLDVTFDASRMRTRILSMCYQKSVEYFTFKTTHRWVTYNNYNSENNNNCSLFHRIQPRRKASSEVKVQLLCMMELLQTTEVASKSV